VSARRWQGTPAAKFGAPGGHLVRSLDVAEDCLHKTSSLGCTSLGPRKAGPSPCGGRPLGEAQ